MDQSDAFFLTETEVSTLMDNSKTMREKLEDTGRENEKLKSEISSLTEELNSALKEEKVNVQEVAQKLAEEKIRIKRELWDEEKMMIL